MSVDSLMDNGASLESLKPTNILFSWEKTSSLDEVLSICKLQKHFGAQRCRYSNSNLSPSLLFKWYSKFTILVDLYGPLKLVLIFAASTASTLLCIKNTLKLKKIEWSETLCQDNCHFIKQNRCLTLINYLSTNFCRIIFLTEFYIKFASNMWRNGFYCLFYLPADDIFRWQVCYCSPQSNCLSINFERQLDPTASWPPNIIDFTISRRLRILQSSIKQLQWNN